MAKYLVLFTAEAIDPNDDSFRGMKIEKMMFAYPGEDYWCYDSVKEAKADAKANDYVLNRDYIVVRIMK
jgi:hypothetical protein